MPVNRLRALTPESVGQFLKTFQVNGGFDFVAVSGLRRPTQFHVAGCNVRGGNKFDIFNLK